MHPTPTQGIGLALFVIAIVHSFSTRAFDLLARRAPAHAGLWHLFGEIETVFGLWAAVLILVMAGFEGWAATGAYLDGCDFTQAMFVFAIMVVAGSRPIVATVTAATRVLAACLPLPGRGGFFFLSLTLLPLTGSLLTEPAALTLAALMLSRVVFAEPSSGALRYASLAVLFVNVSVGGTLTPFAAPPLLMVAAPWHWGIADTLSLFGWRAVATVLVNGAVATAIFSRELAGGDRPAPEKPAHRIAPLLVVVHILILAGIVAFAHQPPLFLGLLLFFLGLAEAYPKAHNRLVLREGLLVAFFLAGLVVLGREQEWWLQPALEGLHDDAVFIGAVLLTAVTDNAALTYLGSLLADSSEGFRRALVTGAVTGGGLTVIANAPNPAGIALLRRHFEAGSVHPLRLLAAALPPTLVAIVFFRLL